MKNVNTAKSLGLSVAIALCVDCGVIGDVRAQDSGPLANGATPAPAGSGSTPPPVAEQAIPIADNAAAAAPPKAEAAQLTEVVVTSTKRSQKLRDIPQSITSLNGEELERRGAENLQDIVKLVPGVNEVNDAYAPRVTIRGISSSISTSSTVGAIFGNVSFSDAYLPVATLDANPFDLQSVEVLKGPQGTLFGASNLNGAIRYVPNSPELSTLSAKYFGEYTNIEGTWRPSFGGVINFPLFGGDTSAVRVIAFDRYVPGYVNVPKLGLKDTNKFHQQGVRTMFAWKPGALEFNFTYGYQGTRSANFAGTDNTQGRLQDGNELRLSPTQQEYNFVDGSVGYNFGWAKLTLEGSDVTKSANLFLDGTESLDPTSPIPLASQTAYERSQTFCEELRLQSPDDPSAKWHWLVGGLASREIQHIDVAINIDALSSLVPISLPLGTIPGGLLSNDGAYLEQIVSLVSAREYAGFGEVTRRFWNRLDLTLGGRFYSTRSGGTNDETGIAAATTGTINPTSPVAAHVQASIPEKGFNPKAALSMHWTKDIMTYAALSRGYRVGGVQYGAAILPQPNSPVPETFKSDTILNYEAGIRTDWFHRKMHLDVTGFYENWKNPQYYTLDASGTSKYLTNVGGVKSEGAEAALQYITPWKIILGTTAAYVRTVTTKPFTAPNGTLVDPGAAWPLSPRLQTASNISYIARLGNWEMNSGVTYTFLGKAITDLADKLPIYDYRLLDFRLSVADHAFSFLPEIELSLNNALNSRGITGKSYNETTKELYGISYTQPRTLNIRVVGRF